MSSFNIQKSTLSDPPYNSQHFSNDYMSTQFIYFLLAFFTIRSFENVAAAAFCGTKKKQMILTMKTLHKNSTKLLISKCFFEGLMPDLINPTQRGLASGTQHNF
jgi:hypothetical protein